jgi:CBS domain-containing protein
VARLQRIPDKPVQELVVALAGPAVNVVLAILFGGLMVLQGATAVHPGAAMTFTAGVLEQLFMINVMLVLFNLLPAFPMDGGRVLRALLAMRMGAGRATQVAAKVGKGMAVLFALVGLFGLPHVIVAATGLDPAWEHSNLLLVLVAMFVWTGAEAEARAMRAKTGLAGVPVAAVMIRRFAAVDPDDTLGAIADYARQTFQRDFPVVVSGRVVGLVGREDIRAGLAEFGPDGRVFQIMHRDFPTVSPEDPAERGFAMLASGAPVVPVVAYGQLAGLLTPEHLAEYVRIGGLRLHDAPSDHEVRSRA